MKLKSLLPMAILLVVLVGLVLLRKSQDQDLTLTDAVGLSLMATRRMQTCWSTDYHLGLTGVALVIQEN